MKIYQVFNSLAANRIEPILSQYDEGLKQYREKKFEKALKTC